MLSASCCVAQVAFFAFRGTAYRLRVSSAILIGMNARRAATPDSLHALIGSVVSDRFGFHLSLFFLRLALDTYLYN